MNNQIARFGVGQNDTKTLTEKECKNREATVRRGGGRMVVFAFLIGAVIGYEYVTHSWNKAVRER